MSKTIAELHERFLSILPRIEGIAFIAYRHFPRDDREDAIAEVVAHAWRAFCGLVRRGKDPLQFPTVLAKYSVLSVRSGKLIGRRCNRKDVCSPFRKKARDEIVSIESPSRPGEPSWKELLIEMRQSTPAETAGARIDIAHWLRLQNRRNRRIAERLAAGNRPMDVARRFKISPARISQIREEFRGSWAAMHGEGSRQHHGAAELTPT